MSEGIYAFWNIMEQWADVFVEDKKSETTLSYQILKSEVVVSTPDE